METFRNFSWLVAFLSIAAPTLCYAGKSACDMLTVAEIGKLLGGNVAIDKSQSGPDDRGGDNCVWTGPNKGIILIRILHVADKNAIAARYKGELTEAYSSGNAPEALPRVGDEANYRNYAGNLKGGVIVGRKGQTIFVAEGSASRENLAGLANTMLSRL